MNGLDILLLAVIGASGVMSFRVGLIREAFALGALLIGLLAGVVLGRAYAAAVPDVVGNPAATQVLFFLACFLIVYILVTLIGSLIARLVKSLRLGWADHLLGLTFGLLRGTIVTLLLLAGLILVLPDLLPRHPEILTGSAVFRVAGDPLRVFAQVLPEKAAEALRERHELYRDLRTREGKEEQERREDSPAPMGL
jgi:membrane protein required for colicin V production